MRYVYRRYYAEACFFLVKLTVSRFSTCSKVCELSRIFIYAAYRVRGAGAIRGGSIKRPGSLSEIEGNRWMAISVDLAQPYVPKTTHCSSHCRRICQLPSILHTLVDKLRRVNPTQASLLNVRHGSSHTCVCVCVCVCVFSFSLPSSCVCVCLPNTMIGRA